MKTIHLPDNVHALIKARAKKNNRPMTTQLFLDYKPTPPTSHP